MLNLKDVERQIKDFYEKYGENPAEDMSHDEWQKYKAKLSKMAKANPQDKTLQKLAKQNIPKYKIDRLRALELDLQMQLTEATNGQAKGIYNTLDDVAKVSQATLAKRFKDTFNLAFNTIAGNKMKQILSSDWSGANWSERLWKDRAIVGQKVTEILQKGIPQGTSLQKMARELKQATNQSFNNAFRLIRTETSHIDGQVTLEGYKQAGQELELEYYEYDAFLDSRTSNICRELDKKRFKVSEAEVGVNYPPMHPNCRSTTQLVLDEEYSQETKYYGNSKEETPKTEVKEPPRISGVKQGKPMSWKEANSGNVNPNYKENDLYKNNCQACVATFEARLRGYDVEALPFRGKTMEKLSKEPMLAFINPKTGKPPEWIMNEKVNTNKKLKKWLIETIRPNERYAFAYWHKGNGHIISLDKTEEGLLRFYDPQVGKITGKEVMETIIYKMNRVIEINTAPRIFRTDNCELNTEILNLITIKKKK